MTPRAALLPRGLAAAVGRLWAPQALQMPTGGAAARIAVAAATATIALLIAVGVVRRLLTRRALARRVTYNLLPTTSFDPSPEDVQRFANQLTRTRPAESRLRPRQGSSIRIRLFTDDEGQLTYQISGPWQADSVLRHQGYAQLELRSAEEISPSETSNEEDHQSQE